MRVLQKMAQGIAAVACGVVVAWAVSRGLTDRFRWSQYPWWVPTWGWAGAAAVLLAVSWASAWLGRARKAGRVARRLGIAGLVVMCGEFGLLECRAYRLVGRAPLQAAAASERGMRVLFWNPSSIWHAELPKWMTVVPADLVVITNPSWALPMSGIAETMGKPWYIPTDRFVVISREPVARWGLTSLGLHGREHIPTPGRGLGESVGGNIDPGRAMWLEIDAGKTLGRRVVVWVLDLPSDEALGRWQTAEQAVAVMRAWPGPAIHSSSNFRQRTEEPMVGFPAPDIVIGDLNSPRGSASISVLAPGMREAYAQAGAGYVATFPQRFPLVHIDQVLTGAGLKATDYRVIDPGFGRHLLQWARIEAESAP